MTRFMGAVACILVGASLIARDVPPFGIPKWLCIVAASAWFWSAIIILQVREPDE